MATTVKAVRARLARLKLKRELFKLADEIKQHDLALRFFTSSVGAKHRKRLSNAATLMAMAVSLHNGKLHARRISINDRVFRFRSLQDQSDFLDLACNSPYPLLSRSQENMVVAIITQHDEVSERLSASTADPHIEMKVETVPASDGRFVSYARDGIRFEKRDNAMRASLEKGAHQKER